MSDTVVDIVTIGAVVGINLIPGLGQVATAALVFGTTTAAGMIKANNNETTEDGTNTNRRASKLQISSTNFPLPVIYGYAHTAGALVEARIDPGYLDTLYVVTAFSIGPAMSGSSAGLGIGDFGDIYFNGEPVMYTDGSYNSAQPYTTRSFTVNEHLGEASQSTDVSMSARFPSQWTSNHDGAGVSYLVSKLVRENHADSQSFASGFPKITATITGSKLYDLRDGTTAFSRNPVLAIYDYLKNDIYGFGIDPATELNTGSFKTEANYCEESVVTYPGGPTQQRFTCDGALDTRKPLINNLKGLLSSCRGQLLEVQGQVYIHINKSEVSSSLEFNSDNIVGNWNISVPSNTEQYNVIAASIIDENRNWQSNSVLFPSHSQDFTYLSNDNGFVSKINIDLPFTNNVYRAQQIAAVTLAEGRNLTLAEFTATDYALQCQPGTIIKITHEFPGWTDKQFRVVSMGIGSNNTVRLLVVEYDADAYDLTSQYKDRDTADSSLPNPFLAPSPKNVVLSSGTGSFLTKVSWEPGTGSFIDHFEVESRHNTTTGGDGVFRFAGHPDANKRELQLTGPRQAESWQAQVRQVNKQGISSPYVTSSNLVVQINAEADPTFDAALPTSESIIYGWDWGNNVGSFKLYSRENASIAGADPVENDNYLAYDVLRASEEVTKELFTSESAWRRTKIVSYNMFDERGTDSGILETQTLTSSLGDSPSGPPTVLTPTLIDNDTINISWETGSAAVDSTQVYVDDLHKHTVVYPGPLTSSLENHMTLAPATSYSIKVRDNLNSNFSTFSTTIQPATSGTTLDTPTMLSAEGGFDGAGSSPEVANVRITFEPGNNAATAGHEVYTEPEAGGGYSIVASLGAGVTEYIHNDNSRKTSYYNFEVKSVKTGYVDSALSNPLLAVYLLPTGEE